MFDEIRIAPALSITSIFLQCVFPGRITMIFIFTAIFVLPGCGTVKSSFRVNEAIGFSNTDAEIGCKSASNEGNIGSIEPINLNCYKFPGTAAGGKTAYEMALDCVQNMAAGKPGADSVCQFYRNEIQAIVIRRSNAICDQHKGDILAQAALLNLGFGIGGTATSALGAVLSGVQTKTNLAGITALLTGTQAHLNQELYQKQFAGTIISAIESSRATKKSEMEQKRAQASNLYTVDAALIDAQEYHYRCSFYHGVSQITKAVERQDQTSRARLIQRIDALRSELDKTDKMQAEDTEKKRLKSSLTKQIEDLQALIKATVD